MHPILFKFDGIVIYSYGALMVVALMVFSFYSVKFSDDFQLRKEDVFDGIIFGTLVSIISSRLAYVLLHARDYLFFDSWDTLLDAILRIINIREGGFTIFGALLAVPLFVVWFAKHRRISHEKLLNLYAFSTPWAVAIGRLGCFLNGCCVGKPWNGPWAVEFPYSPYHGPRHPTQIYELLGMLVLAFLFLYNHLKMGENDRTNYFSLTFMYYGVLRFIIEFFREGTPILFGWFNVGHLASLMLFVCGLVNYLVHLNPQGGVNGNGTRLYSGSESV